jgi:hypothetical protein
VTHVEVAKKGGIGKGSEFTRERIGCGGRGVSTVLVSALLIDIDVAALAFEPHVFSETPRTAETAVGRLDGGTVSLM